MAEIASAYVSLLPSAKGFGAKLDSQIGGDVDSSGKKAGSKWGAALKSGAAVGVAALGAVVVKTLGDSVRAASEAQQAVGGVEAVFGKYADAVLADSKKAAEGLGLSAAAYNELITVSGAMLKNKGIKDFADQSKSLVTTGADLAAMFGGTTTQAVEALNSAMRGESDPIEKYGIALNAAAIEAEAVSSGLVKNVKNFDLIKAAQNTAILAQRKYNDALKENGKGSDEALAAESSLIRSKAALTKALDGEKIKLTDAQKAQAALSLVQKQSADASGAFARESDTLAGQQQRLGAEWDNLKVTLGTALLPALTEGASLVRTLVNNFDTIGPALAVVVGGMAAFKVASLASAAASAVMAAGTVGATGATWSLNAALSANPIGIVIVALTALGVGLVLAYKKSETFRGVVDSLFGVLQPLWGVLMDNKQAFLVILGPIGLVGAAFITVYKNSETFRDVVTAALDAVKTGMDAVGKAGTWLWNKALQPAFKFIIGGVASILDMWSSMLDTLGNVPGFGWAKDAAEAMGNAAEKAREVADGIKKIPTSKKVTITTLYVTRNAGKEKSMGDDFAPRMGLPDKKQRDDFMDAYGRGAMDALAKGLEKGGKKSREQLTKALDGLESKLSTFRDTFATISDSVSSAFAGNLFEAATATDFVANLTAKKGELTSLLSSFKTLQGWGISPAFLSQLFASGNGGLITELAGMGQAGAVSTANLFGEVTNLGAQLGNAVAANDVGPNIDKVRDEIKELRQDLKKLPKEISKANADTRIVLEGGSPGQRAYLRTGK